MQQSVNGNVKHKTGDGNRERDFSGNKASIAVFTATFLVCSGFAARVGLAPAVADI